MTVVRAVMAGDANPVVAREEARAVVAMAEAAMAELPLPSMSSTRAL